MPRRWLTLWASVVVLSAACGGRTAAPDPATQGPDVPNTGGSAPTEGSGSEPVTVETSSETLSARPSTTTSTSDVPTRPSDTETSTDMTDEPEPIVTSPTTCAHLCGNGVLDSCDTCFGTDDVRWSTPGAGAPLLDIFIPPDQLCTTTTEVCDGAVSPEETCQALGFLGGTLGCNPRCQYDDSQCHTCLTGAEQPACRDDLGAGARSAFVALASNSTQLVAAWDEACDVVVSWFDGELRTLTARTLKDAFCPANSRSPGPYAKIVLTPSAERWILEVGNQQFILSAEGEVVSQRDITGNALLAASRAGDIPPLVVRELDNEAVTASLLDSVGNELWTSELTNAAIEPEYGSAAAVASGFLVALRTTQGVNVFHLDSDTGAIVETSAPGTSSTEYPQIASVNGETRLVWTEFGETHSVMWAKLDEQGRRLGDPVILGGLPKYFNRSPIVVDGTDTVVLFGGYTGTTGVGKGTHVRRLDAEGATLAGDVANQVDPNSVQWPQVVLFDGAIVTAWVGKGAAGRVGLARVEL